MTRFALLSAILLLAACGGRIDPGEAAAPAVGPVPTESAPLFPGYACMPGDCVEPEQCVWHADAEHMTSCSVPGSTGTVGWLVACRTDADCAGTSSPLGDGGPTPVCSYADLSTPPSLGSCWRAPACTPRSKSPLGYPYYDCVYVNGVWPVSGTPYGVAGEVWSCPSGAPLPDPLCMTVEGGLCCPLWVRP